MRILNSVSLFILVLLAVPLAIILPWVLIVLSPIFIIFMGICLCLSKILISDSVANITPRKLFLLYEEVTYQFECELVESVFEEERIEIIDTKNLFIIARNETTGIEVQKEMILSSSF